MAVKILLLALAGALGAVARYGCTTIVQRAFSPDFPWGTMVVNMMGCFIVGLFWSLAEEKITISPELRVIILVGFLGAFTTFSTFIFETGSLMREASWTPAIMNILTQNAAGILLLLVGIRIGRSF